MRPPVPPTPPSSIPPVLFIHILSGSVVRRAVPPVAVELENTEFPIHGFLKAWIPDSRFLRFDSVSARAFSKFSFSRFLTSPPKLECYYGLYSFNLSDLEAPKSIMML